MKKTYITPTFLQLEFETEGMTASSVDVNMTSVTTDTPDTQKQSLGSIWGD